MQELERARVIDGNAETFAKEMALIANAQANDCYVRGEYRRAIELYNKAIEGNPADGVFYENLANAWEQEPDQGMHALDQALEAYRRAESIRPGGKHAGDIERLSRRKDFASSYGEKVLDWLNIVTPIVVEVASDLIPLVSGQASGLSDEVAARIAELRKDVERRFGVKIPGVRVRRNTGLPNGTYIILMMDVPWCRGPSCWSGATFRGRAKRSRPWAWRARRDPIRRPARKGSGSSGPTGSGYRRRGTSCGLR